jgi:hypothetical protein
MKKLRRRRNKKMNDNNFEIGDEVMYISDVENKKVNIFGSTYSVEEDVWLYAIKLPNNKHIIVREDTLQEIGEPRVGDKILTHSPDHNIFEILFIAYDKHYGENVYLGKMTTEHQKNKIELLTVNCIKGIIYEGQD